MKPISENDLVDLVCITPHNFLYRSGITRKEASDIIAAWYLWREAVRKKVDGWEKYADWLENGTLAHNVADKAKNGEVAEEGTVFSYWAIAWKHVLGMYVKERDTESIAVQEKMAAAMSRLAEIEQRKLDEGNEWKEGDE